MNTQNDTQLPQFTFLEDESREFSLNSDNQHDFMPIESHSNPQVQTLVSILKTEKPVYVDDNDRLIYDSNLMKIGVLYKVKWQNYIIGLRRDDSGKVDFYEFEPDNA